MKINFTLYPRAFEKNIIKIVIKTINVDHYAYIVDIQKLKISEKFHSPNIQDLGGKLLNLSAPRQACSNGGGGQSTGSLST